MFLNAMCCQRTLYLRRIFTEDMIRLYGCRKQAKEREKERKKIENGKMVKIKCSCYVSHRSSKQQSIYMVYQYFSKIFSFSIRANNNCNSISNTKQHQIVLEKCVHKQKCYSPNSVEVKFLQCSAFLVCVFFFFCLLLFLLYHIHVTSFSTIFLSIFCCSPKTKTKIFVRI